MFIFHHTDLDGRAGAAILTRRYPDATVMNYNYFYEPERSLGRVAVGEPVIFADITPTMDNLRLLMSITNDITIIDHHSSSKKDLQEAGLEFPGIQTDDGLGACALVWEWCHRNHPKPMPFGIKCIAEYDYWQRNVDNKRFHFGIQTFNTFPTNGIWDKILQDDKYTLDRILDTGAKVMSYIVPYYKKLVRSYASIGRVGDYSAVFLNVPAVDSSVFDDLDGSFDVYIRGVFGKDHKWLISLTTNSDDVDVSEIARGFDGGGHAKSAGCCVNDLFDLFTPNNMLECANLPIADTVCG